MKHIKMTALNRDWCHSYLFLEIKFNIYIYIYIFENQLSSILSNCLGYSIYFFQHSSFSHHWPTKSNIMRTNFWFKIAYKHGPKLGKVFKIQYAITYMHVLKLYNSTKKTKKKKN